MDEKHILIVDGEEASVQATAKLLESYNYKINVACNGSDALKKAHQYPAEDGQDNALDGSFAAL